jgi:adenylate cyclase
MPLPMKLPFRIFFCFILIAILPLVSFGQSKEDQMRQLKEDLKQQQQQIEFIQEQHDNAKKQQLEDLSKQKKQTEQELLKSQQDVSQSKEEIKKSQQDLANKSKEAQMSEKELAKSQEDVQRANILLQHKQDSIKHLTDAQALKDLEINNQRLANEKQAQANQLYLAVIAFAGVILVGFAFLLMYNRKRNRELAEKNRVIEEEKKKSEELLLNILPQDVVDELKSQGKTNARSYQMASVLFADIKDFTKISETLSPEQLVSSLDSYFEAFDKIIEGSKVEKIKTIGDAYVCVGGVPVANENNPEEVVRLGLAFQRAVLKLKEEREKTGQQCFDVRIGIHTGPLVAGVVGIKKFAYDIWGDTVNMAARMQQHGEPYQINISQDTYDIIKHKFTCVYRGKVEIKGKGEIDMYFVDKEL